MDFHSLPRRDLQALAKRNGIRANMTNGAMADALAALPAVDGIEEYVLQPVAEATPAAETELQAAEMKESAAEEEGEEREKQEISLPGGELKPQAVIILDDREEEEKGLVPDHDEEKAPAGRRRATRSARVEPVAAPATRKRAAASKAKKGDAAVEAVPARATRARSQVTVSVAEDEAPKARRTSRRAVATQTGMEQEGGEKGAQGDVSDIEATMTAPVSSDEGGNGAEEMEAAMDARNEEQNAPVEEQSQEDEGETEKEDAGAEAVPARATRARSQRTGVSAAAEEAPKARRTSRRAVARKTGMEQEEEEKGAQESGDVPDMGAAVPSPVSSDEGSHDAEEMEAAIDAQNEEQFAAAEAEKGDAAAEAVPARATRARRQRTVVSAAEEKAPKARRTSRRAAARKTSTEQEEEEKATHGDVSDVETAVPAPVSSDEGGDGAEQFAAAEAVPTRATRARSQRTVAVAEEEAPKARRTSRRAPARKENAEQEVEENATQCDVCDVEDAVPYEEADGSEEMEAAIDVQNEEQNELVEEQNQEDKGVVADIPALVAEDCMVDSSVEEQLVDVQQCEDSPVVLGLAEQEGSDTFQNDAVSSEGIHHASEDTEMVSVDEVLQTPLKSGEATEEVDFTSNVGHGSEEFEVQTSEEVLQSADKAIDEQEGMAADVVTNNTDVSVEDMADDTSEENGDCTVEEELPVEDHVDSSVQEPLVHVQQCKEIPLAGEDTEMVPVNEVQQAVLESCEATQEVGVSSNVGEEDEHCTVEEEPPVAEHVDSSVQEALVDVQQCEATEDIHLAGEDTEMLPVNEVMLESGEATEEVDCTSDVGEQNEDCAVEEEPPVTEDVDSSVQEPLVDVQQCEEIYLASEEDAEMVPVLESGEATEEVDFASDAGCASEEIEVSPSGERLQSAAKAVEENEDTAADEVPIDRDENVEEEAVVPQRSEAMDKGVVEVVTVDNLSQATVTDDKGAVNESGFTADLADVSIEEEAAVAIDEMQLSLATMDESVKEELATVDNLSQATATDDEGALKETGFTGELMDVPVEEEGVVTADEIPHSSATMDEDVEEVVTVNNLRKPQ